MIVKGLVSAINTEKKTVDVILPEYSNIVTRPLKVYGENFIEKLKVNDFVMVVVFNDDFNDCMVLPPPSNIPDGDNISY